MLKEDVKILGIQKSKVTQTAKAGILSADMHHISVFHFIAIRRSKFSRLNKKCVVEIIDLRYLYVYTLRLGSRIIQFTSKGLGISLDKIKHTQSDKLFIHRNTRNMAYTQFETTYLGLTL